MGGVAAREDEPLDSPLHRIVGDDKRRSEVKDLVAESSPGVEDSSIECTGERTLSVGAEAVVHNAFLGLGACGTTHQSNASQGSSINPSVASSTTPIHFLYPPAVFQAQCLRCEPLSKQSRNSDKRGIVVQGLCTHPSYPIHPSTYKRQ
jgi:hypothetical protein